MAVKAMTTHADDAALTEIVCAFLESMREIKSQRKIVSQNFE
jgi:hypothetical protein